ncbi:CRTAC1 family protein, partial [Brevirhabdus sp.]|uniref:CRTAC1 family protein n=1 Tax=Brevirhabdus sp. TaxID=2004514 RepID=UPI0040597943
DGGWEHFVGGGVAVFDCNDDGLPELLAAGGENPARLFINRSTRGGDLGFEPAGDFQAITHVTGAYPLDIDGDGRLDLAVLRVGSDRLLRGLGGCRFEEASKDWGFRSGDAWTTAFSATWRPGDARPTLAFGSYVDRADPKGPFGTCDDNRLYRPTARGYAPPVLLTPGYCALSMLFSDWQRRGQADLRVSNDRHYYVRGGSEQMWRMDPLRLLGPEDGWADISIWGMGIASRDLTGDGRPEVMLTSMGDQLLLIARPGGYDPAPFTLGTYAQRPFLGDDGRPSTGWHAEFGDVNNDARPDLFIAKGNVDQMPSNAMRDPDNLLVQQPDGTFEEAAQAAGVASVERGRGASLSDLNGDGLLDLVVVNRRAPMALYRNVTRAAGHWLKVDLRLGAGNRRAVGAWVALRTAQGTQVQEVTVGGGHAGGRAGPLHFGLGRATQAQLRVTWPGGAVSDWTAIEADRTLIATPEGGGLRIAPGVGTLP